MALELRIAGPDLVYAGQALDLPRWTQQLLDRYFAEPYLRESLRIRRETAQRRR